MADDRREQQPLFWPKWSAQVNDLVGGWVVTTYPAPMSEHVFDRDRDPQKCGYVVADCMTEDDARAVADCLNSIAYKPKEAEKSPERWRREVR